MSIEQFLTYWPAVAAIVLVLAVCAGVATSEALWRCRRRKDQKRTREEIRRHREGGVVVIHYGGIPVSAEVARHEIADELERATGRPGQGW